MITISSDGIDAVITGLADQPRAIGRALIRAMNRGMASGRTVMVRAIAADLGMKQKDVRDALVYREAFLDRPETSLAASLKRIPLMDFYATGPEPSRGRGGGVRYRLTGGHGRIETAFLATMKGGHRGVFDRIAGSQMKSAPMRKDGRGQIKRQAIRELFGPSLGRVFFKYRGDALARAIEMFQKNFGHELEVETNGFVKAGPGEQGAPADA